MSKIKVIAFDVYGTILCADDAENIMSPRCGFVEFIIRAKNLGLKTVTSSDADLDNLKLDLAATFRNSQPPLNLEIFDDFFQLSMYPKVYQKILCHFKIRPAELMVIGDSEFKDLAGAPTEAVKVLVPSYKISNDRFDFQDLIIP